MLIQRLPILFAALLVSLSLAADDESTRLQGQAKASVAALASALKSELSAALQAGGPLQAIAVCHTKAPAIAAEISAQQGLEIGRVSERNRNPANAPTAWQIAVLEDFESRKAAGEDPASLIWHDVADTDGGREYRFMKAIPTAPLCLACHGETLAPPVAEKLAELYPEDKATGFREGDLRGAFVVTRSLNRTEH